MDHPLADSTAGDGRFARQFWVGALALLLSGWNGAAFGGAPENAAFIERAHRYVGTSSCSASNCHGGTRVAEDPGFGAYLTWIQRDPHARAGQVLHDELSQQMVQKLGWKPAHEESRCLVCHAGPGAAEPERLSPRFDLSDGVACEACHGPAEHWLRDHSRPGWKMLSSETRQSLGLRETKDFPHRAKVCAECHVGDALRDVNHDLIAAGHPRLGFEFSAYLANYPRHWSLAKDQVRARGSTDLKSSGAAQSVLETQLWLAGQSATVEAALSLTKARAESESAPWPELAEYSCFSCHHELQADSWRQFSRGRRSRSTFDTGWDRDPPGVLPWNSWLLAYAGDVVETDPQWRVRLVAAREEIRRPAPDRARVAREAAAALDQYRSASPRQSVRTRDDLVQLLDKVTSPAAPVDRHWEGAAQAYLAVCAIAVDLSTWTDVAPVNVPQLQQELSSLRSLLALPEGRHSPSLSLEHADEIRVRLDRIRSHFQLPPVLSISP